MADFHQTFIKGQLRGARFAQCQLRSAGGACKRRGHCTVDAQRMQALAQGGSLANANLGQGNIHLPLIAAFGVPRGFAVAGKEYVHARQIQQIVQRTRLAECAHGMRNRLSCRLHPQSASIYASQG